MVFSILIRSVSAQSAVEESISRPDSSGVQERNCLIATQRKHHVVQCFPHGAASSNRVAMRSSVEDDMSKSDIARYSQLATLAQTPVAYAAFLGLVPTSSLFVCPSRNQRSTLETSLSLACTQKLAVICDRVRVLACLACTCRP